MSSIHTATSQSHHPHTADRLTSKSIDEGDLVINLEPEALINSEMPRLIAPVRQALRELGHPALRDVEIEQNGAVVLLWGKVPSYYQKQLAQAAAQHVDGVGQVANGLEVQL